MNPGKITKNAFFLNLYIKLILEFDVKKIYSYLEIFSILFFIKCDGKC